MTNSDPLERESEPDNKDETSEQADISPQALLEKRLEELEKECADYKDKWMRAAAEVENTRKQGQKREEEAYKYSITQFTKQLLPVLDSLEQALKQGTEKQEGEEDPLEAHLEGLLMIQKIFVDVLKEEGVTRIETIGSKFNPQLHQAIAQEESEEATESVVLEEYLPGYQIHDRVLRTATVKVQIPQN